ALTYQSCHVQLLHLISDFIPDLFCHTVRNIPISAKSFPCHSQDFQRLEESVANMKANADALNRDIATIHSNIVQEYNTLKGY
ncbi:hypothetical protein ACSLPB_29395, partial [Escherichia coli]